MPTAFEPHQKFGRAHRNGRGSVYHIAALRSVQTFVYVFVLYSISDGNRESILDVSARTLSLALLILSEPSGNSRGQVFSFVHLENHLFIIGSLRSIEFRVPEDT